MSAGAQALGHLSAELDAAVGFGELELLSVGVRDHELHAFEASLDHIVDGVAASSPDAEYDDPGL
jgi:hypothetical protein